MELGQQPQSRCPVTFPVTPDKRPITGPGAPVPKLPSSLSPQACPPMSHSACGFSSCLLRTLILLPLDLSPLLSEPSGTPAPRAPTHPGQGGQAGEPLPGRSQKEVDGASDSSDCIYLQKLSCNQGVEPKSRFAEARLTSGGVRGHVGRSPFCVESYIFHRLKFGHLRSVPFWLRAFSDTHGVNRLDKIVHCVLICKHFNVILLLLCFFLPFMALIGGFFYEMNLFN